MSDDVKVTHDGRTVADGNRQFENPVVKRLLDKIRQQQPAIEQEHNDWKARALAAEAELDTLKRELQTIRAILDAACKEKS